MDKNKKNLSGYGFSFKDYIKILENPDKIGLNNGIWSAPILKGYDKNQRGYGIDINTNKKAKALTNDRPGRWLTEKEADTLMDDHINYITEAANKHIKGFSELPFRRRWALLGMLYRGDSVNKSGININEPDDLKFFKSISDYYRSKGLNTRANSSDEFFNRPLSKLLNMFKLKNGGFIRKMLNASGGPIQKQKYKYLNEAILFAEDYRNSPGFKERWNRIGKVPGTYRIKNSKYNPLRDNEHKLLWEIGPFKKGNYIPWKEDPKNSMYKYGNGDFYIGTGKKPGDAFSNWKDLLTHEAGHYLEESLNKPILIYKDLYKINSPLNFYSEIYPVFRKSKSYKNVLNFISGDKEDVSEYNKNPVTKSWDFNYDWGTSDLHDASPSESYADLFLLRKKLLDSGVYDVRKANNPFTKEHLKIFKKKNKDKIRLFDNFSDDDIIWMMNNVAENNNKNLNMLYNYYAKQGGKMNIIEFLKNGSGIHIKEKNKGKFTSYCGGKVTDECILKGKNSSNPAIRKRATFAANARKWKHKEGGMLNLLQKFLGGGKTSFWSKAGDFMLNSGLALNLLGAGMNAIFGNPQKKSFNESAKIAKSEVDMLTEKLKQLAMLQADQDVLNLLLLDPANPNAFGGPIVLKVLREGFYKKYLKDIKENANQQKALIDAQSQLMSDGNTSDFLTSILGTGLNAAIGYFGNKVSNNTSTTNNSGGGWTMNYNSLYGNKNNYNTFFLTGSLPKMNSVVAPNTSWLNNNPL